MTKKKSFLQKQVFIAFDNTRNGILGLTRNLKPLTDEIINSMGNAGFEPATPSV